MASHYWIKLYHEILDDPKMGRLRDTLWRRVVECFLMAGEIQAEGHLPPLDDMAWRLHANPEILESELNELAEVGILEKRNGGWFVTNFADRQSAMSAAERAKRWRERQRKQDYYAEETGEEPTPNENRTNRSQKKNRKEKEVDVEEIARVEPSVKAFCSHCNRPEPDLSDAPPDAWLYPGLEIVEIAGGNPNQGAGLVQATVSYMDDNGLSYKNLGSLVNVARTVKSARASPNGSGGQDQPEADPENWKPISEGSARL